MGPKSAEITPATKRLLDEMSESFPELLREQSELMKKLNAVNARVGAHRAMFEAYGIPVPSVAGVTSVPGGSGDTLYARGTVTNIVPLIGGEPASGRAHRGEIKGHIDEVLKDGPMKTVELRDEILKRFGIKYGMSSLYRILAGVGYRATDKGWKLR